ncbi:MAG: hypothetical protein JWN93_3237 [Hyphomicrobiales bacterium]|nr:hypothetical protein [Hyphomicrobiales bacterium]
MSLAAASGAARDPLAGFDLDTLLAGAARLRANRVALSDGALDGPGALTYAALEERVSAIAGAWRELGLAPGERVLIVADARPAPVIAMLGALRARLDVAMLTSGATADEIARFALSVDAAALAGEPLGADDGLEDLLRAAAQTDGVRLVASLGGAVDGAVTLDEAVGAPVAHRAGGTQARIVTARRDGTPVAHAQRTLVAAALDFVTQARIGMRTPILSTLSPARFAGLVAGPAAGLMAGAPVVLHGPFESGRFLDVLERLGGAHVVVPGRLLGPLGAANLMQQGLCASVALLERCDSPEGIGSVQRASPPAARRLPPIVDLIAVDECAAFAEPRGPTGLPGPLAFQPHTLTLDGQTIVSIAFDRARRGGEDAIMVRGAAVSPLEQEST